MIKGSPKHRETLLLNFGFTSLYAIPIGTIAIRGVFFVANLANLNSPSLSTIFFPYLLIFPSGKQLTVFF